MPEGFDLAAGFAPPAVENLDAQFRTIDHVQRTWSLPNLPSEVTLDLLAEPGLPDSHSQEEFLYGLANDLTAATQPRVDIPRLNIAREIPAVPGSGAKVPGQYQAENAFVQEIRSKFAAFGGVSAPKILVADPNHAVLDLKRRGILAGYLPEDTPLDGAWSPALNGVRRDLVNDDVKKALSGDDWGSASSGQVLDQIDRWLGPASLLSMAAGMLAIPDIGHIGQEFEDWGGNVKSWLSDPTDLGKFGKALGPLDDIALPALNAYLMFTGFRAVMVFAQVARAASVRGLGVAGARGVTGASDDILTLAFQTGQKAGSSDAALTKWGRTAASQSHEMARFVAPGKLSRMAVNGPGHLPAIGRSMQAWRRTTNALMTKKAVQQGMKIGFVGELESQFSPDRRGFSPILGRGGLIKDHAQQFKDFRTASPVGAAVSVALDIPLAPMTVFAPGTFTGPVRKATKSVSSRLLTLNKEKILSIAVTTSLLDKMASSPQYAVRVKRAQQLIKSGEINDASVVLLTGHVGEVTDAVREVAGHKKAFLVVSAAIDKTARAAANAATDGIPDGDSWRDAYYAMRNHLISRLRPFEFDKIDMADSEQLRFFTDLHSGVMSSDMAVDDAGRIVTGRKPSQADDLRAAEERHFDADGEVRPFDADDAETAGERFSRPEGYTQNARMRAKSRKQLADAIESGEIGEEWINDTIGHHNALRGGTLNDIMDGLDESDLALYLDDTLETLDNWDPWIDATTMLQDYVGANSASVRLRLPNGMRSKWAPSSIETELMGKFVAKKMSNKMFNRLQQQLRNGETHVTTAKLNTVTKQDVYLLRYRLKLMMTIKRQIQHFSSDSGYGQGLATSLRTFAESNGVPLKDLDEPLRFKWVKKVLDDKGEFANISKEQIDELEQFSAAMRTLAADGFDDASGLEFIDDQLRNITRSRLWEQLRISRSIVDEAGTARLRTTDELINELRRAEKYTAAEITLPKDVADKLRERGYKAVAGRQFLQNSDLSDLIGMDGPLGDITRQDMRRRSLGLFFSRDANTAPQILGLRRVQTLSAMTESINRLRRAGKMGAGGANEFDWSPGSAQYESILNQVYDFRTQMQEAANMSEALATDTLSKMGARVRNSGLPFTVNDMSLKQLDRALNGAPGARIGTPLYSREMLKAIQDGLLKGKVLGWERNGLANVHDVVVANSWVRSGLNMFRYTEAAEAAGLLEGARRAAKVVGVGASPTTSRAGMDLWRNYQQIGGAVIGASIGYSMTGSPWVAGASAITGGIEGSPSPGMFARNVARSSAFTLSAQMGASAGLSDGQALAGGALAATFGFGAMRKVMTKHAVPGKLFSESMANYSRLGYRAMKERDRLRFALSPVFDIQRYTEGVVLSLTAKTGDVDLPVTFRPMRKAQELTGMSKDEIIASYRSAGNTIDIMDAVDTSQAWFLERGLFGFSPTEWMAATHARLMHAGWDSVEAADKAREIYTYGLKGRSGLEQSVNFVLFPFSFQKKYVGAVGSFLAEDIGRTMVLHDSLKMLEIVSEKYDLEERYRDRLPILNQLRKVNALAYGLSPGQLGGINRPYLDLIRNAPGTSIVYDGIVNLFLPQALQISSSGDAEKFRHNMKRVIPIIRDVQDLTEDVLDQGHVITSSAHMSKQEESRRGWEEFDELRRQVSAAAEASGISMANVYRGEGQYAGLRQYYDDKVAEIGKRNPYWKEARVKTSQRAVEKASEIADIVRTPETPAESMMAQFDAFVKRAEQAAGGGDFRFNADLMPQEFTVALRKFAIKLALQNPEFLTLYRIYYQNLLGPIEQTLR